jgi:hypothetical protein
VNLGEMKITEGNCRLSICSSWLFLFLPSLLRLLANGRVGDAKCDCSKWTSNVVALDGMDHVLAGEADASIVRRRWAVDGLRIGVDVGPTFDDLFEWEGE